MSEIGARLDSARDRLQDRASAPAGRLLTVRAVAERLDVSAETVLRWVRKGDLPAVRLSCRAVRIREPELDAWLDSRAT